MRKIFNRIACGITVVLLAAAFAGCGTVNTINATVGSWTTVMPDIGMAGTYIINEDGSYSVTMTGNMGTEDERTIVGAETGAWELGDRNTVGMLGKALSASTITFTKANGEKYTGKINGNRMIIEGMEFTKQ